MFLLFAVIILVVGAYIVFLLLISSPPKDWEAIQGDVLDAQTNEPIEDAWVIYHWKGNSTALVASAVVCYHVESAQTDSNGRFVIPAWNESWENSRHIYLTDKSRWYKVIFKPGYRESSRTSKEDSYRQHRYYLEQYEAKTREEELDYLQDIIRHSICGPRHERKSTLFGFYQTVYRHAVQIGDPEKNKEMLEWIKYELASIWNEGEISFTKDDAQLFFNKEIKGQLE